MNWKILILFGLLISISACETSDEIPPDLQIYLDRFEEEAKDRGKNYSEDIANTRIHLAEILTSGVLGQCVRDPEDDRNAIQIDKSYWETANDLEKEFVVFHELGHCILSRDHTNVSNADGTCQSIMYDGFGQGCMLTYSNDTREEMIDELFN